MSTIGPDNVADHLAHASGSRRLRAPRTLRVRLVVTIVLLIAAVCAVVGVATAIYLGDYLVRQLDGQLVQIHQSATGKDHQSGSLGSSARRQRAPAIPVDPRHSGSRSPSVRWRRR